jgi:hypothetical protein
LFPEQDSGPLMVLAATSAPPLLPVMCTKLDRIPVRSLADVGDRWRVLGAEQGIDVDRTQDAVLPELVGMLHRAG